MAAQNHSPSAVHAQGSLSDFHAPSLDSVGASSATGDQHNDGHPENVAIRQHPTDAPALVRAASPIVDSALEVKCFDRYPVNRGCMSTGGGVAVADEFGRSISTEPTSHPAPCGRELPR